MSVLITKCPTCNEEFSSADDMYGTSCGHLYHTCCLQEWKNRGTSCPQCLVYNPTSYKIYLNFDETVNNREEEKLISSNEKITQLSVENSEHQNNFLKLQKQFTSLVEHKRVLEERIKQIGDSEDNFLNLQGQFTECSEQVKCLQQRINQLNIEHECQLKELELKRMENISLSSFKAGGSCLPDDILKEKIKFLEQRLKHISEEFEKEIAASTKLSVDNLKLKSYIEHFSAMGEAAKLYPKQNDTKQPAKESEKKPLAREPIEKPSHKENYEKAYATKNGEDFKLPNAKNRHDNNSSETTHANCNSVFIKGLSLQHIEDPLENTVLNIASKMNLSISKDDLIKVNYVDTNERNNERHSSRPSLVQLSVQFKTRHLKDQFLTKRFHLKNNPTTKYIIISELMSEDVYSLFKYAKDNLRSCGYNCVFSKGSTVFAKTHRGDPAVVCIKNKAQVDNMTKIYKEKENENNDCNVDENLYQL